MQFTVLYPSGKRATLDGVFGMVVMPSGHIPAIDGGANNKFFLLDPRCVVISSDEAVCESYFPEKNNHLPKWAKKWMAEHPEWPVRL